MQSIKFRLFLSVVFIGFISVFFMDFSSFSFEKNADESDDLKIVKDPESLANFNESIKKDIILKRHSTLYLGLFRVKVVFDKGSKQEEKELTFNLNQEVNSTKIPDNIVSMEIGSGGNYFSSSHISSLTSPQRVYEKAKKFVLVSAHMAPEGINDHMLYDLIRAFPNLERLEFYSANSFTGYGYKKLAKIKGITSFCIEDDIRAWEPMVSLFKEWKVLKQLRIKSCRGFHREFIQDLSECNALEELIISGSEDIFQSESSILALQNFSSLKKLKISSNALKKRILDVLFKASEQEEGINNFIKRQMFPNNLSFQISTFQDDANPKDVSLDVE